MAIRLTQISVPTDRSACFSHEGVKHACAEDPNRDIAINAEVREQGRHGTQQQTGDDGAVPVEDATDDGKCEEIEALEGAEGTPVELTDIACEQSTRKTGKKAAQRESPGPVNEHIDAACNRNRLAFADQRPCTLTK